MMWYRIRSTFAFVIYPESTPVLEAYRAVEKLRTAGFEPTLTVVNFVIPTDQAEIPFVRARQAMQAAYLRDIQARFPVPVIEIPCSRTQSDAWMSWNR